MVIIYIYLDLITFLKVRIVKLKNGRRSLINIIIALGKRNKYKLGKLRKIRWNLIKK